jgi:hypothetical protein
MADKLVQVLNDSGVEKTIYETGTGVRYTIAAHTVLPVPENVAQQFLGSHPRYCKIFKPVEIPHIDSDERVWIANMTGSPFVAATFEVYQGDDKPPKVYQNLLFKAQPLTFTWYRGQENIGTPEEPFYKNVPPITIEVLPFRRDPYPKRIADWLVQRCQTAPFPYTNLLREVRAPSDFEPNETWSLADMRLYASMIDPEFFTRDFLNEKFPREESIKDPSRVGEIKQLLYQYLFFRLVDDEFSLVTREGFEKRRKELEGEVKLRAAAGQK